MSGTLIVSQDANWMPANWMFDGVLERTADELGDRPDLAMNILVMINLLMAAIESLLVAINGLIFVTLAFAVLMFGIGTGLAAAVVAADAAAAASGDADPIGHRGSRPFRGAHLPIIGAERLVASLLRSGAGDPRLEADRQRERTYLRVPSKRRDVVRDDDAGWGGYPRDDHRDGAKPDAHGD